MPHQPKLADIFAAHSIVATLECDAVIPHMHVSIYRLMQLAVAVIGIQLELVGFHQREEYSSLTEKSTE